MTDEIQNKQIYKLQLMILILWNSECHITKKTNIAKNKQNINIESEKYHPYNGIYSASSLD